MSLSKLLAFLSVLAVTTADDDVSSRLKRTDLSSAATLGTSLQQQATLIQGLQSQLAATQNQMSTLQSIVKNQSGLIATLAQGKPQKVAFAARFSSDPVNTSAVLEFDDVSINAGNSYDPNTGFFRAPVAGIYSFYFRMMGVPGNSAEMALVKENVVEDFAHVEGVSVNNQGSLLLPLQLNAGQRVWIKQHWGSRVIRGGTWTVFTGFLMDADV